MAALAMAEAETAPLDHVRQVVRRAHSSFYWGMRVLPRRRREAMFAIYAFCREVDDIADGSGSPAAKRAALAEWRREIDGLYAGRPSRPVARALLWPVAAFALPKDEFLAIIDGMETDAKDGVRGMSMAELQRYCRRVAGAVGLLSVRVFGDDSPAARELAVLQGEALQFTNILRDLGEDAGRGRLYLPQEILDAHGIASRDPAEVLRDPNLPAACAAMAALALDRYERAETVLARCDRTATRPAAIMLGVYRGLLNKLMRRGWENAADPVRVSRAEKLWLVLRRGFVYAFLTNTSRAAP